jgi:serine/threonine protein kinase
MIGETLGSYVIEQAIGAGGMGQVFLGVHRRIGRRVAIKLLLPEYSASPALLGRFFNEARATSSINHPGIVQILDCDVHPSGRAYIIMEYLYGESLRTAVGRVGRLVYDLPAVVSIVAQAAEAVGAAHDKGIVHRDLKPDNMFLLASTERGRIPVKVLDFGVAKLLAGDKEGLSSTRTGSLLGTPLYMSPEQCRSAGNVDYRSDIYSLGCICFEMLCGRPPFEGRGVTDLLIAHASQPPPPPSSLGIDVPDPLEQLIMSMLAKEPGDRPSTMGEVASMLLAMVDWLPPAVQPFQVQAPSLAEASTRTAILPAAISPSPVMYPTQYPSRPAPTPLPPHTTLEQSTGTMDAPVRLRRPPSRRGWVIGVTMVVAALGVGAYLFSDELIGTPRSSHRVIGDEGESDQPTAGPKPFDPPTSTGSAGLPATITVEVEGGPPGLQVLVDGDSASVPVRLPRDGAVHKLVFKAPGYQSETRIIEASKSQLVTLALRANKEAADDEPKQAQPGVHPPPPPRVYRRRTPPANPPPPKTKRGDDLILDI